MPVLRQTLPSLAKRRKSGMLFFLLLLCCAVTMRTARAQSSANAGHRDSAEAPMVADAAGMGGPTAGYPLPSPTGSGAAKTQTICGITHLGRCIGDLAQDDKGIFTSPLRVKPKDAYWMMPIGAATGLAFAYDTNAEEAEGYSKSRENTATTISDFGSFYASGGWGAALYFAGLARHNPKLAETGRLGAEAVIDAGTVTLATKLVTNRERPLQGNRQGDFWTNGTGSWHWDSSFPSDHATSSMALARVVAGEYPHWYVAIPAYGFAETIGISRILANAHFPSDVVVGQTIGFLTGSYILDHRSLYRGRQKSVATRILQSAMPIASQRTHTYGASVQIPMGR